MLTRLLRFTQNYFPRSFFCAGCKLPTAKTVCEICQQDLLWNDKITAPPFRGLEGAAPLLHSLHRTHSLIRHWKEHPGTELKRILFRMPKKLEHQLVEKQFFAIIPIPQDRKRSQKRGHESAEEVAAFFSHKLAVPCLRLLELKSDKAMKRMASLHRFDREFSPNPFQIHHAFPEPGMLSEQLQEKVFRGKEIRLLLVDDLMTSGSTLSRGMDTLHELLPRARIWAGALGIRPNAQKSVPSNLFQFRDQTIRRLSKLDYLGNQPPQY